MANDGLRDRLLAESKVLRDAGWISLGHTMLDAHSALSQMNALLAAALRHVKDDPDLAKRIAAALMNGGGATAAPAPDPAHPEVGRLFFSAFDRKTYRCDTFSADLGFLLSPVDQPTEDAPVFVAEKRFYALYVPVESPLDLKDGGADDETPTPAP